MKAEVVDAAAASNRRARRPMAIWQPMRRPMFRAAVDIAVAALRAGHIFRRHPLRVRGHELAAAGVIAGRRTPDASIDAFRAQHGKRVLKFARRRRQVSVDAPAARSGSSGSTAGTGEPMACIGGR